MGSGAWPVVLIEVLLVMGGVLAFGWWQLRDVAREQREALRRRQAETPVPVELTHSPPVPPDRAAGGRPTPDARAAPLDSPDASPTAPAPDTAPDTATGPDDGPRTRPAHLR